VNEVIGMHLAEDAAMVQHAQAVQQKIAAVTGSQSPDNAQAAPAPADAEGAAPPGQPPGEPGPAQ